MMLRTSTLAPPTWAAMLPQELSAATIRIRPLVLGEAELAQPAKSSNAVTTRAGAVTRRSSLWARRRGTPEIYQPNENESHYRLSRLGARL
jgi:hypothetical protein